MHENSWQIICDFDSKSNLGIFSWDEISESYILMRKLVNVPYISELIKVMLTGVNKRKILNFTVPFDKILILVRTNCSFSIKLWRSCMSPVNNHETGAKY